MGLDMYLYAERKFPIDSEDGKRILAAAEVTKEHIKNSEDYLYLGMWDWQKGTDSYEMAKLVHQVAGTLPFMTDDTGSGELIVDGDYLKVRLASIYWRKANAIHSWFVRNVQENVDDCGTYPVHPEQLAKLKSECEEAAAYYDAGQADNVAAILPPTSGFFFGGTDIDDWYRADLQLTIEAIDRLIHTVIEHKLPATFAYHSSW